MPERFGNASARVYSSCGADGAAGSSRFRFGALARATVMSKNVWSPGKGAESTLGERRIGGARGHARTRVVRLSSYQVVPQDDLLG